VANTIGARPRETADRSSFGHSEGDLLIFRRKYGKANLTSLVERCSLHKGLVSRGNVRHRYIDVADASFSIAIWRLAAASHQIERPARCPSARQVRR